MHLIYIPDMFKFPNLPAIAVAPNMATVPEESHPKLKERLEAASILEEISSPNISEVSNCSPLDASLSATANAVGIVVPQI